MRIHVLSDLHLEVAGYQPHQVECDVVVLAGDIANHTDVLQHCPQAFPVSVTLNFLVFFSALPSKNSPF